MKRSMAIDNAERWKRARRGPRFRRKHMHNGRLAYIIIQVSPYFDPIYTRTGWIGQPPVLDRHDEVVTDNGDVVTLRQATP